MRETDKRIVDISDIPVFLSVSGGLLVIRVDGESTSVPFNDLAVIVVSHPAVTYTGAVLKNICESGGIFLLCDDKRMPAGMLLPLVGNHLQTERFATQAEAGAALKKRLWKEMVQAKVRGQARLLESVGENDNGLKMLAAKVLSGDPQNIEAQASRRYWKRLFGKRFKRDIKANDENMVLNYGYAIVRSITARALCAAGLHPSLGIHHHNRYNPFCLADDLMEPFRPIVDETVLEIVKAEAGTEGKDSSAVRLDKSVKAEIIGRLLSRRLKVGKETRNMFDSAGILASSLVSVFAGKRKKLVIPGF